MNRFVRLACFFVALPTVASAFTEHSGTLQHDEVWTVAGSPHVLRATTIVPEGMRLVVESGVTICAAEDAQFQINGALEANGSPDRRVLITGMDQNQWGGMVFGENSESFLNNVTVATSSAVLMRVMSARFVKMSGDSLQYSPVSDNAVGLQIEGGHVDVVGGVVISPMGDLYSISLLPVRPVDPVQFNNQSPAVRSIDIQHGSTGLVKEFQLEQNYPNPFNPTTTIRYNVPWQSHVVLTVYDVSGKEVRRLVDADQTEGGYAVAFAADELSSGIYFYRLQAGGYVDQKRMLLVK